MLVYTGNLVMTWLENLGRPYPILLGTHKLTATTALSCCSREKNTAGNAIRSRQGPFTLTDNASGCLSSQIFGKLAFKFYVSKTTGFCIGHFITISHNEPRALRISKNFLQGTYATYVQAKIAITLSPEEKPRFE
jgi:hypothetical protein